MKKIIITGISGQDGSYMVDYLLANTSHLIYGVTRRLSKPNYSNFQHNNSNPRLKILTADLSDSQSIDNIVREIQPDYFINFAAQSFVGSSWQIPEQTFDVDAVGVIRCLEAIRKHAPKCRFYNAGSSEEFGDVKYCPQDEKHPLSPRSPYGAAKASARHIVKVYRESYNLFAIQGYLFNHESPRRGEEFVTRKITLGISRILKAIKNKEPFAPIELGNLDAKRDWSHALDFVDGVWKMMNQDTPKEFVLSSNETHTVRDFINIAFKYANIDASWHGNGLSEELSVHNYLIEENDLKSSVLVKINPQFFRPAEVDILLGDSTLARAELGWQPKYSFTDLVKEMVESDIRSECQ
jgi:GDPmannose 4,6-dehydratase